MADTRNAFWQNVPGQPAGTVYNYNVSVIETKNLAGTSPVVSFGFPVKLVTVSGEAFLTAYVAGDATTTIYGFMARNPYGLGPESPLANAYNAGFQIQDIPAGVMPRGYINVDYTSTGTPILGAAVYINHTGVNGAVGTVGDGSDAANYAIFAKAVFANNGTDAFGIAQIRVDIF